MHIFSIAQMHRCSASLAALAFWFYTILPAFAQRGLPNPQPHNAVDAVVAALHRVPLVALGERHDTQEMYVFYLTLLQSEAFRENVDDIVLEVANAHHQNLLDRFVSGDDVSLNELRRVWRDATNTLLQGGDLPHYEEFLQTVRALNQASPSSRQIRVLAGDPPLDWSVFHEAKEFWAVMGQRDHHYAELVRREVLGRQRKALLIMGRSHLTRTTSGAGEENVITLLEQTDPGSLYVIHLLTHPSEKVTSRFARWRQPAIASLKGTWLGALRPEFGVTREGGPAPLFEETIDAVLYLGARDALHSIAVSPYTDEAYLAELNRRSMLIHGKPHH